MGVLSLGCTGWVGGGIMGGEYVGSGGYMEPGNGGWRAFGWIPGSPPGTALECFACQSFAAVAACR